MITYYLTNLHKSFYAFCQKWKQCECTFHDLMSVFISSSNHDSKMNIKWAVLIKKRLVIYTLTSLCNYLLCFLWLKLGYSIHHSKNIVTRRASEKRRIFSQNFLISFPSCNHMITCINHKSNLTLAKLLHFRLLRSLWKWWCKQHFNLAMVYKIIDRIILHRMLHTKLCILQSGRQFLFQFFRSIVFNALLVHLSFCKLNTLHTY